MPELDKDFITSKIERTHRAEKNKHGAIFPIIAKFSDLTFSKHVKYSFIKAAKDENVEIPLIVSQMYSAALTIRRNDAMIKRKELRKDDH